MGTCASLDNSFVEAIKHNNVNGLRNILQKLNIEDMTRTDSDGRTCLLFACCYPSSPEPIKVICQKLVELGGIGLLKVQLAAKSNQRRNCIMIMFSRSAPSTETLKFILDKVVETGGPELLKSHLLATDEDGGYNTLSALCFDSSLSTEKLNLFFDKSVEVGGNELVKQQLCSTDDSGRSALVWILYNPSSTPELTKMIWKKLLEVGGAELLKKQLSQIGKDGKSPFLLWLAVCRSLSKNHVKLAAALLFHFDLFKEQYAMLKYGNKDMLKECAGIDSASWTPDSVSQAEVKDMLGGGHSYSNSSE